MNNASEILRSLGERLQGGASVKNVFGDPITVDGKTVIPVARVRYGFGGGGGRHGEAEGMSISHTKAGAAVAGFALIRQAFWKSPRRKLGLFTSSIREESG